MAAATRSALGSGKKDALAWAGAGAGLFAGALRVRNLPGPCILTYHRVFDVDDEDRFPFDPELVTASVADFEWQMRWIRRHMHPVPLETLLRSLDGGEPVPPRAVAVTFDDGHRDNYTHAFPVLRACGVPATIFLSTGYIDGAETFWFDQGAYRVQVTDRTKVSLPSLGLELSLGDAGSRRLAWAKLVGVLKQVPEAQRLRALEELASATGIARVDDPRSAPLTWAQVAEMRAGGVTFGSHTVSHPILSRIDEGQLQTELRESRAELVRRDLGDVDVLAYPVGGADAYDPRVVRMARECGYRLGITYIPGVSAWPPEDRFAIRRLHVERYTTRARFQAMLAFPEVFA